MTDENKVASDVGAAGVPAVEVSAPDTTVPVEGVVESGIVLGVVDEGANVTEGLADGGVGVEEVGANATGGVSGSATGSPEVETGSEVVLADGEKEAEDVVLEVENVASDEGVQTETGQMGGNDPFIEKDGLEAEVGAGATAETKVAPERPRASPPPETDNPTKASAKPNVSIKERLMLLQQMARATIALRREKKYQQIMDLFARHTTINNDDVQKLLRVSDSTATRYTTELTKRGKIQQVGTTGRGVAYIKK